MARRDWWLGVGLFLKYVAKLLGDPGRDGQPALRDADGISFDDEDK